MTEKEQNDKSATDPSRKNKDNEEDGRPSFLVTGFLVVLLVIIVILLIALLIMMPAADPILYYKKPVKDKITTAISNDADLETIKHIFSTKSMFSTNF